ncbi:hypothetical protein A9Q86_04895 [Flavobacteriales bacterium 33_180_T64]|nr:hypothetical protein A9Q86_04895 [Flavobacteriales bacterium 33_180_T64]
MDVNKTDDKTDDKRYLKAKGRVRKLKGFYIHLCGYIIGVSLLVFNLIIIEEGEYKIPITWLIWTLIIAWGIILTIHAWVTFKGQFLFTKRWEERKIQKYLDEKEDGNQMWE